ncbi:hypothetical protein BKA62DRAFT_696963 [Auriculariales sp. MPI-PUGE-AT-0066]|nr:hypothetical protein BKA62DRAFT_696963 [Auriculariales sp. MPI-PUGE-AT-0066]
MSQTKPSIIITGLPHTHPAVAKIADPEQIRVMLEQTITELRAAGYEDIEGIWIGPDDGTSKLVEALQSKHRHGLIIGAGVRKSDDLMFWMEELIRTAHAVSPKTQILFNTTPKDNLTAAGRLKLE